MGRYYETNGGRGGKFMFGVQSSDDPEYMGMHEQEPATVDYYADKDDIERIKNKLVEQYDILGVPKDQRKYYCKDCKEMAKYENEVLHDKVFVTVNVKDEQAMKQYEGKDRWCSEKGDDYIDYEINNNALVLARIRLALDILSDIKDDGYCLLTAEL